MTKSSLTHALLLIREDVSSREPEGVVQSVVVLIMLLEKEKKTAPRVGVRRGVAGIHFFSCELVQAKARGGFCAI